MEHSETDTGRAYRSRRAYHEGVARVPESVQRTLDPKFSQSLRGCSTRRDRAATGPRRYRSETFPTRTRGISGNSGRFSAGVSAIDTPRFHERQAASLPAPE